MVKFITGIDLNNYQLYDNEINTGNNSKDMRLDIIFVSDINNPFIGDLVNIELYKDFDEIPDMLKSHYYLYSLIAQRLRVGDTYKQNIVYQININDGYYKVDNTRDIVELYEVDNYGNIQPALYKIFNVYLSNFKDICYNGDNENEALLSLLRCNNYEEMKKVANGNRELMELINELEELSENDKILGLYNREVMERKIRNYVKEEGISIGETRGEERERNSILNNMLKNNISTSIICKSLNMTKSEVEQIRNTIN